MSDVKNTTGLYRELQGLRGDSKALVSGAGKAFNLQDNQMTSIGMVESNLDPNAKAGTSSAQGLYQFTGGTWKEMLTKYGAQYGVPANAKRTDPVANAIMGGAYLRQNADTYKNQFGEDAGLTEMYLGHFLGETGRGSFMKALKANPNTPVSQVLSKEAIAANSKALKGKTVQQVYNEYSNKLSAYSAPGQDRTLDSIKSEAAWANSVGVSSQKYQVPEILQSSPAGTLSANAQLGLSGGADGARDALSGSFLRDTEAAAKVAESQEKGLFDGTWKAVMGEVRLSGGVRAISDVLYDSGLKAPDASSLAISQMLGQDTSAVNLSDMSQWMNKKPLTFTPEMYEAIKADGLGENWFPYIQEARTQQELAKRLSQAKEMQAADNDRKAAGFGGGIVGGIAAAPFDPLTYVGFGAGTASSTLGRVFLSAGEAAAGAVASEYALESGTKGAIEGQYLEAAAGAALFGGSVRFIGDKIGDAMTVRIQARVESAEAGVDDISLASHRAEDPTFYIAHPTEEGAVIMGDGTILSKFNPLNPETAKAGQAAQATIAKAARSAPLPRSIQDISISLFKNDDNTVRSIASDLMRSSVGLEGGGRGVQRMTAEDILSMNESRDFLLYRELRKDLDEATDTGFFALNRGSDSAMQAQRQIVEAIESGDHSKLSDAQRRVVARLEENFESKFEAATAPSIYGRADAPAVFDTKRAPAHYFPQVFEEGKVNAAITKYGSREGLQANIKRNWLAQVAADHKGVQAKFREMFADDIKANKQAKPDIDEEKLFQELVEDYVERKSYGIAQNGDFVHAATFEDARINPFESAVKNNDFTKERNIFDSGFKTPGTDGQAFAINDLRHFDIMNTLGMYNRRMNGDIAIHGATGKTTGQLEHAINELTDPKGKKDLQETLKLLTGKSRRHDPANAGTMLLDSLKDFTLATKGAKMWITQLTELAGHTTNRAMRVLTGGVPALRDMLNPASKFSKADIDSFRDSLFGIEFNEALRPSFQGYRDALVQQGSNELVANVAGGVRAFAANAANLSPWTRLLAKSTQWMIDMSRSGVLGDIASEALTGGVRFRPEILKNADVTPEQYAGILSMMKEHIKVGKDGKFKPSINAIKHDPRSNDLWRLADYTASDAVFRTGKIGQAYTRQPSAALGVALQFKAFMIKGMNGKFMRMANEAGHGRALDHSLQAILGIGFGAATVGFGAHVTAYGMPEEKREAYLARTLDPGALAYNAIGRSSTLGIPLGILGLLPGEAFDFAKQARTTVSPDQFVRNKGIKEEVFGTKEAGQAFGDWVKNSIPAAGFGMAIPGAAIEGYKAATAEYGYEQNVHNKALFEHLRNLVPNDPLTQALISELAQEVGVADTYK